MTQQLRMQNFGVSRDGLGAGGPEELLDRFHLDTVPSSSGVTHLIFWRR